MTGMFSTLNFAAFILYAVMLLWYILNSTSSFIGIITYSHKVFLCKLNCVKLRTYVYRLVYHTIILVCMRCMIQQIWVFENWKVLQYWNRRLNTKFLTVCSDFRKNTWFVMMYRKIAFNSTDIYQNFIGNLTDNYYPN